MKTQHALAMRELVTKHNTERAADHEKHAENIKMFKQESQQILNDCQNKLLCEFEKNRQTLICEQKNVFDTQEDRIKNLEECLLTKIENVKSISAQLNISEEKLKQSLISERELNSIVEELRKKIMNLKADCNELEKKFIMSEERSKELNIMIDSLKVSLSTQFTIYLINISDNSCMN